MDAPLREPLTPAERELLAAAGPLYFDVDQIETPRTALAATVEPDDWRLYHLMRDLSEADRARVLTFAELLFNLRHAQEWAASRLDQQSSRREDVLMNPVTYSTSSHP